jgi:hypothetical protein
MWGITQKYNDINKIMESSPETEDEAMKLLRQLGGDIGSIL